MTDKVLYIRRWSLRSQERDLGKKKPSVPTIPGKVLIERRDHFGFTVEDGEDLERFIQERRQSEMR